MCLATWYRKMKRRNVRRIKEAECEILNFKMKFATSEDQTLLTSVSSLAFQTELEIGLCRSLEYQEKYFFSNLFIPVTFVSISIVCNTWVASYKLIILSWITEEAEYVSLFGKVPLVKLSLRVRAHRYKWAKTFLV